MNFKSYREIILSYANSRGKGLPLTAEEYCNAMALYIQEVLPEYQNETLEYIKSQIVNEGLVDSYIASVVNASMIDTIVAWADDNFNAYVKAFFDDEDDWFTNYITTKADDGDLDTMFGKGIVSSGAIHGSDTVVVDVIPSGDGVEIHLDGEVVTKLARSIQTPIDPPEVDSVPVVKPSGGVSYEPYKNKTYTSNIYIQINSTNILKFAGFTATINNDSLTYRVTSTKSLLNATQNELLDIILSFTSDQSDIDTGRENTILKYGILSVMFMSKIVKTSDGDVIAIVSPCELYTYIQTFSQAENAELAFFTSLDYTNGAYFDNLNALLSSIEVFSEV